MKLKLKNSEEVFEIPHYGKHESSRNSYGTLVLTWDFKVLLFYVRAHVKDDEMYYDDVTEQYDIIKDEEELLKELLPSLRIAKLDFNNSVRCVKQLGGTYYFYINSNLEYKVNISKDSNQITIKDLENVVLEELILTKDNEEQYKFMLDFFQI